MLTSDIESKLAIVKSIPTLRGSPAPEKHIFKNRTKERERKKRLPIEVLASKIWS